MIPHIGSSRWMNIRDSSIFIAIVAQVSTTRYGEYHIALLGGQQRQSWLDGTCGARREHRKLCRFRSLVSVIPTSHVSGCGIVQYLVRLQVVSGGWRWVRRLCITLCRGLLLSFIIDWIRVTENGLSTRSPCFVSPAPCCVQSRSTGHPSWSLFFAFIGHDRILLCLHLRLLFTSMVPTQLRSIENLLGGPSEPFGWPESWWLIHHLLFA